MSQMSHSTLLDPHPAIRKRIMVVPGLVADITLVIADCSFAITERSLRIDLQQGYCCFCCSKPTSAWNIGISNISLRDCMSFMEG